MVDAVGENLLSPRRARRVQSARRQTVGVLRSRFHGSTKSPGAILDERSSARRASGRTPLAILLRPPQLNLLSAGFFVFRIPAKKTFGTRHAAVQKRSRRFCVSKIQLNRSAMWTQADENLLSPRRARRVQSARRQTVGVLRSRFHGSTKSPGAILDERSSARRASGRTPLAILLRPPQLNLLSAGFFVFRIPAKNPFGTRHAAVQKRSRRFCVSFFNKMA